MSGPPFGAMNQQPCPAGFYNAASLPYPVSQQYASILNQSSQTHAPPPPAPPPPPPPPLPVNYPSHQHEQSLYYYNSNQMLGHHQHQEHQPLTLATPTLAVNNAYPMNGNNSYIFSAPTSNSYPNRPRQQRGYNLARLPPTGTNPSHNNNNNIGRQSSQHQESFQRNRRSFSRGSNNENKRFPFPKQIPSAAPTFRTNPTNLTSLGSPTTKTAPLFRCDPCNITLDTKVGYENHMKSHIKCRQCEFQAAPKVVNAHFSSVHGKFSGSGFKTITIAIPGCKIQKFQICVGNHPDDIQRWIAERKKRFPRSSNCRNNNSVNHNKVSKPSIQSSHCTSAGGNCFAEKNQVAETSSIIDTELEKDNGNHTIGIISSLLEGYGSSSSEDLSDGEEEEKGACSNKGLPEYDVKPNNEISALPTSVTNKGMLNNDGSSLPVTSTDVMGSSTQVNAATINNNEDKCKNETSVQLNTSHDYNYRTKLCRFFLRNGTCRNGENCKFSHDIHGQNHNDSIDNKNPTNDNSNCKKRPSESNGKGSQEYNTGMKRSRTSAPSTLLQKLLAQDVRREKVLTIKLLKYIVQSNFLKRPTNSNEKQYLSSIDKAAEK